MSKRKLNKLGNPFEVKEREVSNKAIKEIAGLTKTGLKLLEYMMLYSGKDDSRVYVDKKRVMFECDLGDKSFFNGIKNLIDNKIIATSDKPFEYYYNHSYFGEVSLS